MIYSLSGHKPSNMGPDDFIRRNWAHKQSREQGNRVSHFLNKTNKQTKRTLRNNNLFDYVLVLILNWYSISSISVGISSQSQSVSFKDICLTIIMPSIKKGQWSRIEDSQELATEDSMKAYPALSFMPLLAFPSLVKSKK